MFLQPGEQFGVSLQFLLPLGFGITDALDRVSKKFSTTVISFDCPISVRHSSCTNLKFGTWSLPKDRRTIPRCRLWEHRLQGANG
jgi:hypothetical protein